MIESSGHSAATRREFGSGKNEPDLLAAKCSDREHDTSRIKTEESVVALVLLVRRTNENFEHVVNVNNVQGRNECMKAYCTRDTNAKIEKACGKIPSNVSA